MRDPSCLETYDHELAACERIVEALEQAELAFRTGLPDCARLSLIAVESLARALRHGEAI